MLLHIKYNWFNGFKSTTFEAYYLPVEIHIYKMYIQTDIICWLELFLLLF